MDGLEHKDNFSKMDDDLLLSLFEGVVINLFKLQHTPYDERKQAATRV